jgi:hypothetical protein
MGDDFPTAGEYSDTRAEASKRSLSVQLALIMIPANARSARPLVRTADPSLSLVVELL